VTPCASLAKSSPRNACTESLALGNNSKQEEDEEEKKKENEDEGQEEKDQENQGKVATCRSYISTSA